MWKLVIEDDEARRTSVPLTREEYSIGRKEGNSIRLTERNVSRDHVRLRKHANGAGPTYILEDLKSYNGVYVNGIRVATTQELVNGDLVQIGDYRILFQEDVPEQIATAELSTIPGAPSHAVPQQQPAPDFDVKTTQPGVGGAGAMASSFRGSLLMERPTRLVMLVGPTPGVEYPLDKERMTIGRAEDASISINHNSVSRLHCEIHSIGEGRYEIVDKGSSNGIRVNAAELRRGIVEAGDLIELGDVRLKFVAAGQVFVPGPNESQQLTAISDRIAPDPSVRRTKTGIMPFVILGAVVAGLVLIGGFLLIHRHNQQADDTNPLQTPIDQERAILQDALHLCTKEDCEKAHVKATTELRENSPLRETADFQKIEAMWAEWMFARADAEPDFAKKKDIYQRVAQTITVDKERRKIAADKIEALDKGATNDPIDTPPTQSSVSLDNPPPTQAPQVSSRPPATTTTTRPPATATHPTATIATAPPQTATAKPPQVSDVDRARQALLENDPVRAKLILYPKLQKGGTADELNVLKQACKATNDPGCVTECKKRLGQQ